MSFPYFFQNSLYFFILLDLYFFGYWLLDFFDRFLLVFEDFRSSFVNWFELLFLVEILGGFVLDSEVAKLSHFLFHSHKIAIKESFFLDKVIQIKLLYSMRTNVLFIGLMGWLIFLMTGLGGSWSLRPLFRFELWFRFVHVGLLFGVEGIRFFSIDLNKEVFNLWLRKGVLF